MFINGNLPIRFKAAEFHYFNWLYSVAPCFPINASKINIIKDPRQFYDTLCERFKNSNRRIAVASLYIGTGKLEKRLLEVTKENLVRQKQLKLKVLLDYQRGTRGDVNSVSLLRELVTDVPEQCSVCLYQTPRLQGPWSRALPARYNELVGLQHMKLYIADDAVLLSGANCSNDYFQQRQDRYVEIHDADLSNFYIELIDEVSKYSKRCVKDVIVESEHTKEAMTKEINKNIQSFIQRWKEHQLAKLTSLSKCDNGDTDTWIFPLIQMGDFGITQDEQVTQQLMATAPKGSYLQLATGYFNLTDQYAKSLLRDCKANISLLMAHPNANGFLGAAGPAGGIPFAYTLIARKFWQRVEASNQASRVQMMEYERLGWTFHAKGLWYYPPGSGVPWATIIGSANLGERSVRRDLEAQAAIFTVSPDLQERLYDESLRLHRYATECSRELQTRHTPLWVRAAVSIFKTYF